MGIPGRTVASLHNCITPHAKFLRSAREDTDEINLKPDDYSATYALFYAYSVLHTAARVEAVDVFLEKAIGHQIETLNVFEMRADIAYQVSCGNIHTLVACV
jgi:hypothetical protein